MLLGEWLEEPDVVTRFFDEARTMESVSQHPNIVKIIDIATKEKCQEEGLPPYFIMEYLEGRGIRIVVDATKDLLMNVLKYKPFLIKPNNHELGEIFGVTLETRESVVPYAQKLLEQGAQNVIVSMAGEGAVFVAGNGEVHLREAPKGKLVNGVGAGDSMVAGFIAGYLTEGNLLHAFKMGLSTGSASAFSEYLATKEEVMKVYETVE